VRTRLRSNIYLKTQSMTATARQLGVSRQTVHRWLRCWFRDGSGDPGQDFLMIVGAEGAADEQANLAPLTLKENTPRVHFTRIIGCFPAAIS
jgi:transposase-like protein